MRILFVTTKSPLPVNDGHSLRSFNLLSAAARHHEVSLLSFVKFEVEHQYKKELESMCRSVRQFPVPDNRSRVRAALSACLNLPGKLPYVAAKYDREPMRREIRRLLRAERFDLVHLDMLPLGRFLDEIGVPVLLNEHNVESALLQRRCESISNPVARRYFTGQQRRLERFEAQVLRQVDHVIACSEDDRNLLRGMAPGQSITVVPNGVDTDLYRPSGRHSEEPFNLAFVGGMNWFPNRDAVEWFQQEVMAQLLELEPRALLNVVGKSAQGMAFAPEQRITMHGFVEDTRPFLERAAAVVVPIRVGGGTRLKVLEAMSMGKALVSTTVGVEGIDVRHRQHVLIADTAQQFAAALVELMGNAELRRELGRAARQLVCDSYRWDAIGQRLLGAYQDAITK